MLGYIVKDFEAARLMHADPSIGAMVICDSAAQAREMAEIFAIKYAPEPITLDPPIPFPAGASDSQLAAEDSDFYIAQKRRARAVKTAALILHAAGTKDSRKQQVEDFKAGKIDLLFVYNMLLTGFDSRRLKKLYLGRIIKAHNLLQALMAFTPAPANSNARTSSSAPNTPTTPNTPASTSACSKSATSTSASASSSRRSTPSRLRPTPGFSKTPSCSTTPPSPKKTCSGSWSNNSTRSTVSLSMPRA